jgi:IclR family KDG regulon transcriptional repressor
MKSLRNGLRCLELLARCDGALPIALVCQELKLPRSSAYRLLAAMSSEGFIRPGPDSGIYVAGPQMLASASAVLGNFDVREAAWPYMRELSEETGHSVYLMVRSGFKAVCIEMVAGNDGLHLNVQLGTQRDLHCSGIAKIFLPSLTEREIKQFLARPLEQFTSGTISSERKLRTQIASIRNDGFAISTGEYVSGARSIGVPITNHQGQVIAGLGIGGSAQKLSDSAIKNMVRAMQRAAARVSADLGSVTAGAKTGRGVSPRKRAA